MLICHCKAVNDRRILEQARLGSQTVGQIGRATGAGTCCGGCVPAIRQILERTRSLPVLSASGRLQTLNTDAEVRVAAE